MFRNYAPFTDWKCEINNAEIDHARYIDIVMPMHDLIEYSDNYSKTSGSLWQYCRNTLSVNNNDEIANFGEGNLTDWFNFEIKITGQIGDNGTKGAENA